MREKEEASRFALAFSSFEDLVTIQISVQRVLDFLLVNIINFPYLLKLFGCKLIHSHLFIDD